MPLKKLLVETKPREISGPRSANRFEFQNDWVLCRLLDLHKSGNDYLIVLDYHDDVLVLDSSADPKQIDFYQIKTKQNGTWTRRSLIERDKGRNGDYLSSILGKLIANKLTFPEHTRKLTLVSTQGFKLTVKGGSNAPLQKVCLNELDESELSEILDAIRAEHSLPTNLDCADYTHLEVTVLSLADHANHSIGILADFLNLRYPGKSVPIIAIYRTLCDEIRRKTQLEGHPADFGDLCARRAITRSGFERILNDVRPTGDFDAVMQQAVSQLQLEEWGFDDVRRLRDACSTYEIERMDSANLVVAKGRAAITNAVQSMRTNKRIPETLTQAIDAIRTAVGPETLQVVSARSNDYLLAMIVMALYEN